MQVRSIYFRYAQIQYMDIATQVHKKTKSLAYARLHIYPRHDQMPIENRTKGEETKLKEMCELACC